MKFPIQSLYNWYRNILRNPQYRWWIILGTLVYLLSPVDFLPDVFPIVGEIDDIALVTLLFAEVSQMVVEQLRKRQPVSSTSPSTVADATTVDVNAVPLQE
ncbi:MAG: YkvA family protein [Thermosynechococcaceae cyanobacterium]